MGALALQRDIMLAEDDADDVEIFDLGLKGLEFPYLLRHAENGDVLFIMLKDKLPYILFLDIHMPCKDGIACIVEIRKNREYDKMPVIMYTSEISKKIIEEAYRSGANLYLAKTNTIADLTDKLRKIFSIDWDNYLHFPPHSQFIVD
ncbi:response regulator [Pseudobacter ginsenosidimutans]|uniref:Two-component system response regulator ResD n=1 Tax=Pseudobacter ginsenosidimutans TaxID=661488 RepID=A0A4Q7MQY4_9BACT|nr:response regulator [Pseudobacter ginsenosidimutans]QEC42014.1 response regulator [Pseudobacter ginsenosidimutans]RZS71152.1 two-component system response regulator ResD [Pseudobacter ginsenosidimutans]